MAERRVKPERMQKLWCIHDPPEDPDSGDVVDLLHDLTDAERDLAATQRELERWRHGAQVEGDYVCPDTLRADQAEQERDAARAELGRLYREVQGALDLAGSRWSEWGERALSVAEAIDAALAAVHGTDRPDDGMLCRDCGRPRYNHVDLCCCDDKEPAMEEECDGFYADFQGLRRECTVWEGCACPGCPRRRHDC